MNTIGGMMNMVGVMTRRSVDHSMILSQKLDRLQSSLQKENRIPAIVAPGVVA